MVSVNERNEREVNVGGVSCMCGGTHVKNTAEIKGLKVSKIKKVEMIFLFYYCYYSYSEQEKCESVLHCTVNN